MPVSTGTDVARVAPLVLASGYLNWVSTYGAALVTTLAIVYGVLQVILRTIEFYKVIKKERQRERDGE